ncbi:MAG: SLC13 family permease, partial [Phreatobacter sp.]
MPIAVLAMLAVWFAPTPADLTIEAKKALVLFAGVFVLYLTEAIPLPVNSLAVVPATAQTGTG